jgi:cytochrome c
MTKRETDKMRKLVSVATALAALMLCTSAAQADNVAKGKKYAKKKCTICHTWKEGGKNKVGPNMWALYGRAAGTIDGFKYSDDFKTARDKIGPWDDAKLAAYLADPKGYLRTVTGNPKAKSKMTVKVKKKKDIANVIAYLQTLKK